VIAIWLGLVGLTAMLGSVPLNELASRLGSVVKTPGAGVAGRIGAAVLGELACPRYTCRSGGLLLAVLGAGAAPPPGPAGAA
jgi:hypothetical protein